MNKNTHTQKEVIDIVARTKKPRSLRHSEEAVSCIKPFDMWNKDAVTVKLTDIIIDEDLTQVREKTRSNTIKDYATQMQNGTTFPPLKVGRLNHSLYLIDGFHRVKALQELGITEASVIIDPIHSLAEARWRAYEENGKNGLPLTAKEKQKALERYIEAGMHIREDKTFKSFGEITREVGLMTKQTVINNIRRRYPEIAKKIIDDNGLQKPPAGIALDFSTKNNWKDHSVTAEQEAVRKVRTVGLMASSLKPEGVKAVIEGLQVTLDMLKEGLSEEAYKNSMDSVEESAVPRLQGDF